MYTIFFQGCVVPEFFPAASGKAHGSGGVCILQDKACTRDTVFCPTTSRLTDGWFFLQCPQERFRSKQIGGMDNGARQEG